MQEIPSSLTGSMIVASIAFMIAVWMVVHFTVRKWQTSLTIAAGLVGWYGLVFILGKTGFFAQTPLFAPNIILAFIVLIFWLKFLLSRQSLQAVFKAMPLHRIMAVQIFRVMGVGFLYLYWMGLLPGEFALATGYGDLVIGLTAPVVAYLYFAKKAYSKVLAKVWNYLGIADLVAAISLGIFTYPRPFQVLPTEISNQPIALFPLVIVPVFAVPLSILLHLFTLRALRQRS